MNTEALGKAIFNGVIAIICVYYFGKGIAKYILPDKEDFIKWVSKYIPQDKK